MSSTLERPPLATRAPTPVPTREPEPSVREPRLPPDRSRRTRRWAAWVALPVVLLAIAIGVVVGLSGDSEPVDSYVPDGTTAGLVDGWFRPDVATTVTTAVPAPAAEVPLPQGTTPGLVDGWYVPGQDVGTADAPIRQGITPGLADGWFEPGVDTGRVVPSYPVDRVR